MADHNDLFQTIVFADIAGSTRLYEKLGDIKAQTLVFLCIDKMIKSAELHDGHLVKTIGDEVMCRFDKPDMGAKAAVSMQETVSTDPDLAAANVQLRIGMHHGQVLEKRNDLYGDAVNIAARMAGQAKAGQIITTKDSLELMCSDIGSTARMVDHARLKGKQDIIDIYELSWGQPEEMTMVGTCTGDIVRDLMDQNSLLTLDLQSQHVSVNYEQSTITMGRDKNNRLVVNHPKVSRLHARIEMRKDKFIIIDKSTNGTIIAPADKASFLLRRDELQLTGNGIIYLGKEGTPESPHAIHYQVL